MKRTLSVLALFVAVAIYAQRPATELKPPVAKKVPKSSTIHGDTRVDNYAWLRNRKDPQVIDYLKAETAYADAMTQSLAPFREKLYNEMLARIKQTDVNVPWRRGDWYYNSRTEEGKQYPIVVRQKSLDAPEQVVLDLNKLAEGHTFM